MAAAAGNAPNAKSLIEDITPAGRLKANAVASYELSLLPKDRSVYLKRGSLLFLSSRDEALRKLDDGSTPLPSVPATNSLDSLE